MYFASQFSTSMPEPHVGQFINATVTALAPSSGILCRVGAMRAMNNYCRKSEYYKYIAPAQSAILENICNLLPTANEFLLFLVLETLGGVLKTDPVSTASFEAVLIPMLINVWMRNPEGTLSAISVLCIICFLTRVC
jgi:hypothetical protein